MSTVQLIATILFFILIGLEYLGVNFQLQRVIIGVCGLIVGILLLIGLVH